MESINDIEQANNNYNNNNPDSLSYLQRSQQSSSEEEEAQEIISIQYKKKSKVMIKDEQSPRQANRYFESQIPQPQLMMQPLMQTMSFPQQMTNHGQGISKQMNKFDGDTNFSVTSPQLMSPIMSPKSVIAMGTVGSPVQSPHQQNFDDVKGGDLLFQSRNNTKFQQIDDFTFTEEQECMPSQIKQGSPTNYQRNKPILPPIMPMIQKLHQSSGIADAPQNRKSSKKKKIKQMFNDMDNQINQYEYNKEPNNEQVGSNRIQISSLIEASKQNSSSPKGGKNQNYQQKQIPIISVINNIGDDDIIIDQKPTKSSHQKVKTAVMQNPFSNQLSPSGNSEIMINEYDLDAKIQKMKNAKRVMTTSPPNNKILDSGGLETENNNMLSEDADDPANIIMEQDFMLNQPKQSPQQKAPIIRQMNEIKQTQIMKSIIEEEDSSPNNQGQLSPMEKQLKVGFLEMIMQKNPFFGSAKKAILPSLVDDKDLDQGATGGTEGKQLPEGSPEGKIDVLTTVGRSTIASSVLKSIESENMDDDEDGVPVLNIDISKVKSDKKKRALKRMMRQDIRPCLIYPENKYKDNWDIFMAILLVSTCMISPVRIAFNSNGYWWDLINHIVDGCFFVDIIIIFMSAYSDEDFKIVEDRKVIAKRYLTGWFAVDLLAIFPFDIILGQSDDMNHLIRFARIGRLYKLVKLTKLLRIFKFLKDQSKFLKFFTDVLKVSAGFERLMFFFLIFIILCHITTCLWIIIPQLHSIEDDFEGTWMEGSEGLGDSQLYAKSFYWTITTITTVGYGDISGCNVTEWVFCSLMMIIGVIAFSFANGSLASILASYDDQNAELQEKINVLNKVYKQYYLPLELYVKCKRNLEHQQQTYLIDVQGLLDIMPHKLKVEVSLYIYEKRYRGIKFFKSASCSFISWICPLLKPNTFDENQYIYSEGEDIHCIFFLLKGQSCFVLPSYNNMPYINITEGGHLGIIDIVGSIQQADEDMDNWMDNKELLKRQFTIEAKTQVNALNLSITDMTRLKMEFYDYYYKLFEDAAHRLKKAWCLKIKAIKSCQKHMEIQNKKINIDKDKPQKQNTMKRRDTLVTRDEMRERESWAFKAVDMNIIDQQQSSESKSHSHSSGDEDDSDDNDESSGLHTDKSMEDHDCNAQEDDAKHSKCKKSQIQVDSLDKGESDANFDDDDSNRQVKERTPDNSLDKKELTPEKVEEKALVQQAIVEEPPLDKKKTKKAISFLLLKAKDNVEQKYEKDRLLTEIHEPWKLHNNDTKAHMTDINKKLGLGLGKLIGGLGGKRAPKSLNQLGMSKHGGGFHKNKMSSKFGDKLLQQYNIGSMFNSKQDSQQTSAENPLAKLLANLKGASNSSMGEGLGFGGAVVGGIGGTLGNALKKLVTNVGEKQNTIGVSNEKVENLQSIIKEMNDDHKGNLDIIQQMQQQQEQQNQLIQSLLGPTQNKTVTQLPPPPINEVVTMQPDETTENIFFYDQKQLNNEQDDNFQQESSPRKVMHNDIDKKEEIYSSINSSKDSRSFDQQSLSNMYGYPSDKIEEKKKQADIPILNLQQIPQKY